MAQRKKKDIESALQKKGFKRHDTDHARFVYYTKLGKKTTARTKTSHGKGGKEIGDSLLGKMARQCEVTKQDFLDLIDCPLDRDAYEKKVCPHESDPTG